MKGRGILCNRAPRSSGEGAPHFTMMRIYEMRPLGTWADYFVTTDTEGRAWILKREYDVCWKEYYKVDPQMNGLLEDPGTRFDFIEYQTVDFTVGEED